MTSQGSERDSRESATVRRQHRFYQTGSHEHLQARENDYYSRKLTQRLVRALGIEPHHRVLELGAGFGRFSFHLLEYCESLVAMDLSPRALEVLVKNRDNRGIPAARLRPWQADLNSLERAGGETPFDFIVGLFILHHLPDYAATIRSLNPLLATNARVGFVEPNRRNPLFLAQVACCPEISWREEQGMFTLSYKGVENAFRAAGWTGINTSRFGFFPPQLLNRFTSIQRLEGTLEDLRVLEWILPFLLLTAKKSREIAV